MSGKRVEGRGTRIETMPAGEDLGNIADLKSFNDKLARALHVPSNQLSAETTEEKLTDIVRAFVNEQKISCEEEIYQSDRVIENAYELIGKLINASNVGYYQYGEDE